MTRDVHGNCNNLNEFKISTLLIDSLPEHLKPSLKSVIKLHFNIKMQRDPQVPPNLWNKNEHKYTKISVLQQFPDIIEQNSFNFKYRLQDGLGTLHDCLPVSEWILPVPFVSLNSSSSMDTFNTPINSPMKKAKTSSDF